jgi:hypothetical protein
LSSPFVLDGSVMVDDSDRGSEAYWWADDAVKPILLEQARIRADASIATLTALNSRLASIGGLLFAGAALTTSIATSSDKLSGEAVVVASFAAAFFALGGLASFVGLISGQSVFPGEPPTWWAKGGLKELRRLGEAEAKAWVAGQLETAIVSLSRAIKRRGDALNWGLGLGALGGLLVPVALGSALLFPKPAAQPTVPAARLTASAEVRLVLAGAPQLRGTPGPHVWCPRARRHCFCLRSSLQKGQRLSSRLAVQPAQVPLGRHCQTKYTRRRSS